MSLEDLRDQGVLLPESEWGEHSLETTAARLPVAGAFLAAALSWVLMYVGDGATLTWAATGSFLLSLLALTWICDRAVLRQRRRFRRERRGEGEEGA